MSSTCTTLAPRVIAIFAAAVTWPLRRPTISKRMDSNSGRFWFRDPAGPG